MYQVNLVSIIALILVVLGILMVLLPVEVRFFYQGWLSSHSLLLRLEFLEGRVGIGTKLLFGYTSDNTERRLGLWEKIKWGLSFQKLFRERLHFPASYPDIITAYYRYQRMLHYLRGFVEKGYCRQLHWRTEMGFHDYALTGIAAGLLWAGKGVVMGYLSRMIKIDTKNVHISVIPHFGERCMEGSIHCIFKTRLGHIIVTFGCFLLCLLRIIWDNKKR